MVVLSLNWCLDVLLHAPVFYFNLNDTVILQTIADIYVCFIYLLLYVMLL